MSKPWASVESPDTDGETAERDDNGENYYALFRKVKPPATLAIRSAKSVDAECAKRGALSEEESDVVEGVINDWVSRILRRGR